MSKFESSSHGSTLYFSSHDFFVSHMDLRCIGRKPCCESFGTNVKGVAESLWCLRSFDHCTFSLILYLVLSNYYAYRFPLAIILWGASMLHRNLVTIMLWDRYSLVFSNPSKFSLEKRRKKLFPCNFPCFEPVTLLLYGWKVLPKSTMLLIHEKRVVPSPLSLLQEALPP